MQPSTTPTDTGAAQPRAESVSPWAPYALTAAAAGLGWVLRATAGEAVAAAAAGVLVVPALVLTVAYLCGRRLFGVGQASELAYTAGCWVALAAWTATAGAGAWPHTALVAVAIVGAAAGWVSYTRWQRPAGLTLVSAIAAAGLAAVLFGATRQPNPARWVLVWLAATSVAAVPWWNRQRLRQPAEPAVSVGPLTAAIVKHLGHPVEVIDGSLHVDERGRYRVGYRLFDGRKAKHLIPVVEAVESELGWRPRSIHVEGSRTRANEATVSVVPADPGATPMAAVALPDSILQPVIYARHDTGEAMQVCTYTAEGARHELTGGRTGSGKTRALWTKLKGWTHTDDAVFLFADLSGGSSSAPWEPCLLWRETELDGALAMIEALTAASLARAAVLADRGWESWQPSPQHPAVIFVIDEAQMLLKDNYAARGALEKLIQIARKSGIAIKVMCPEPVAMEGITPVIRKMCVHRECFAMPGSASNWALSGTPAAAVAGVVEDFDTPGQLLATAPGLKALPGRALDTPLADAKAAGINHAARRPQLDRLTADALRASAGDHVPAALSAADQPARGRGSWTDRDDRAVRRASEMSDDQLRDRIRGMAEAPGVLGGPWPPRAHRPRVDEGALTREQALRVAAQMLAQPGGVTPAAAVMATGRSRAWVMDVLASWVRDGVAERAEKGRYVVAARHLAATRDAELDTGEGDRP